MTTRGAAQDMESLFTITMVEDPYADSVEGGDACASEGGCDSSGCSGCTGSHGN
jgi:hypothetical protein